MKFGTTLRLFLAVCLAGAVIVVVERVVKSRHHAAKDAPLFPLEAERIVSLAMEKGSNRIDCARKDKVWHIKRPLAARADEAQIDRILSALEAMRVREVITADQRARRDLKLKDFGLDQPRARFTVFDGARREQILIGLDAPLGNLIFVKLEGNPDVLTTTSGILQAIPDQVETLRDRTVLPGESARTTRLEIQRHGAGFLQLVRKGGKWHIQQPITARADSGKTTQMLDALYRLKVEKFVWDAPAEPSTGEAKPAVPKAAEPLTARGAYGFDPDESTARITVWQEGNELSSELIFGKPAGEKSESVYAKQRDVNSIYLVGKSILDVFAVGVNDLRDRNIFALEPADVKYVCLERGDRKVVLRRKGLAGWVVSEPVEWEADEMAVADLLRRITDLRVQSFADGSQTNLVQLGLTTPACVVQVLEEFPEPAAKPEVRPGGPAAAAPPPKSKANRLWIGQATRDARIVHVKFEDDPLKFGEGATVYEVSPEAVGRLGPDLVNPLVYRDRSMLAVHPKNVKRISLVRGQMEQTVARSESEKTAWVVVSPLNGQPKEDVVEDVLFHVSNLRAFRVEGHNVKDLAPYGLSRAETMLTLGLSGVEGIQKSILIGSEAGAEGRYAMIQGQDVVFVLEKSVADRLTRDLVASAVPARVTGAAPAVKIEDAPGTKVAAPPK